VVDRAGREFSPREHALLDQLASVASVAIANARLYDRERTIARTLQRSLRPGALPEVPGLAAAVRFRPAGENIELGGDFYDLYKARDGGWAALIGDVQGKGPDAAAVTALARHTLRAAAAYEHSPSAVLSLLHRALREQRSDDRFITVAYAHMQVAVEHVRLELACGGHPLPLVVHRDGSVEGVGRLGTLLGTDIDPLLADVTVELDMGDVLVLYTDGVTEVRRQRTEVFGTGRAAVFPLTRWPSGWRRRCWPRRRAGCATTWPSWPSARWPSPTGRLGYCPTVPRRRSSMADPTDAAAESNGRSESNADLLKELVAHLSANRTNLRQEWARRIGEARLLTALTPEEIFNEATSVYDNYVEVLETGSVEALQDYARNLSERIIPRGVETDEVLGIVLLLRDVLNRSLFEKYQRDFDYLNQVLDAYEPAANRITNTVAINFVQERERVIRQQQEAIRELSTPVLQVRERLLILPIIGVLDGQRARQLTEQLLRGIRTNRAKVVVIDITGVPTIDSTVANHLVQTVDASRLMGASVIITGLSPEIAQTLVTLGVELGKVNAVGDLQGGIEEAERLLGYAVSLGSDPLEDGQLR
jgi:rsbT co-antagonist protein RsbR